MKSLQLGFGIAALSSALFGCTSHVVSGVSNNSDAVHGSDDPGDPQNPQDDQCGAPVDWTTATALTIRFGDIPPLDDTGTSGSTGSGGDTTNPDDILLVVSNAVQSCAAPYGPSTCVSQSQVFVTLHPEQLAAGSTIDLTVGNVFFSQSQDEGNGVCSGGGGSVDGGQLVIDSVDDFMVGGHFVGLEGAIDFGLDANLTFTAGRCGT